MQDVFPSEVLKAVFPLLEGQDLGACICVCKQWRDVAKDDYLWRRLCKRRWPSLCGNTRKESVSRVAARPYFSLFSNFCKKPLNKSKPSPKLTFDDLEFYVDIWSDSRPVYSAVVPGPVVLSRIQSGPPGTSAIMEDHLNSEDYKLTVSVCPRFAVKLSDSKASVLVRRRDRGEDRVACLMDMSSFDYIDGHGNIAHAFDYLQISPLYPFVSPIRAWVALLLLDSADKDQEVFGIELDFVEAANNDREVLCLLEILDWRSIE